MNIDQKKEEVQEKYMKSYVRGNKLNEKKEKLLERLFILMSEMDKKYTKSLEIRFDKVKLLYLNTVDEIYFIDKELALLLDSIKGY